MKNSLLTIFLICSVVKAKCYGQNQTHQVIVISEYGEKSQNLANWSISGGSIKAFGEKVNIHPSVFEKLLLQGNVTLQATGDKSFIEIESPIQNRFQNIFSFYFNFLIFDQCKCFNES